MASCKGNSRKENDYERPDQLRAEAREAIAAYEDGADFLFTISRLAAIGERMNILLA